MFDRDIDISGKHATYLKSLSRVPPNIQKAPDNFKVFDTYIHTYMLAAVIGFVNNRKGIIDNDTKDNAGIMGTQVIKMQSRLKYIYRLIMLLDNAESLSEAGRINCAFKEDSNDEVVAEGLKIFKAYVLGGLEVLYETFVSSCISEDDYINKIAEFVSSFKDEQDIDSLEDDIESLLRK